jgi:dTDP-4-amino-4,6-dideoxygalactose transaminase
MIPFNVPPFIGTELDYVKQAIDAHKICGDGRFTKQCHAFLEERFGAQKALLTTSGTTALEMATLLCGLKKGDEVLVPSFTFSSTATSIVLTGATPVFIDVRPDTMNIDETRLEDAITDKTRAIMAVHYAGVACEMDTIMDIAARHNLKVIEDAAQGVMSSYKGRALGTIGDFGCYSFHETKNYSMGEGGALIIRDSVNNEDAEILREKGTDRARFFRGQVDKYTWVAYGSSYLPSDMNAAYLWAQLQEADKINDNRLAIWNTYSEAFAPLAESGRIEVPFIPEGCVHNAHMYYIKLRDLADRTAFIQHMKDRGIVTVFHYVPLHSSPAGSRFGRFHGEDRYTTNTFERLLRMPMYYGLTRDEVEFVCGKIAEFYKK